MVGMGKNKLEKGDNKNAQFPVCDGKAIIPSEARPDSDYQFSTRSGSQRFHVPI